MDSSTTYNYAFMVKLRTAIRMYMNTHKFSKAEYDEVMKVADSDFMKNIKKQEVDRTIFALELLYLYVSVIPKSKRAILNISDKKLLKAKSELVVDMLKLKQRRKDEYNRVKDIIDDSRISAKKYFGFCEEFLKG